MAKKTEHSLMEDAQAFVLGTALCALGVQFLTQNGLITGQTAGAAVLASYSLSGGFGLWFFLFNLPFYLLGWIQLGPRFVIKTFIAVGLVSIFAEVLPDVFQIAKLDPLVGALLAGGVTGVGLLVIFRHGASLGGVGVLGLFLQSRFGIQAGWVQLGFDVILFALALFLMPLPLVGFSLAGAVVVNLVVAVNHRQDRYVGR